MKRALLAALLALVGVFPQGASSQIYKGKTITMIVNYPPGGPTDIEGRIVAQHLPQHVPGQPTIIVKNVGGGSGLLGSNELGDATPDGMTIGFFTLDVMAELTDNPSVRRFTCSTDVVRASSSIRSDCSARDVQTFWP